LSKNLSLYLIPPLDKQNGKTFQEYVFKNKNFSENYKKLLNNVSEEEKKFLQLTVERALYMNTSQYISDCDFTPEELVAQLDVIKNFDEQIKDCGEYWQYDKYKFPNQFFESSLFYYKMGLDIIKNKEKLAGKDFIDAGACGGDSAMILDEKLNPKKIYCFEPVSYGYNILMNNIELNNMHDKVYPIKQGLGSAKSTQEIGVFGAASSLLFWKNAQGIEKEIINIDTLDNFVEKNALDVGLIKIDVEGFDMEVLKGSEQTIKKFKPVILGSIYHNAEQFFEFKPLIESWDLGYKFRFEKLNPKKFLNEISVICEVY
jgi:FkbM family methyltransferase